MVNIKRSNRRGLQLAAAAIAIVSSGMAQAQDRARHAQAEVSVLSPIANVQACYIDLTNGVNVTVPQEGSAYSTKNGLQCTISQIGDDPNSLVATVGTVSLNAKGKMLTDKFGYPLHRDEVSVSFRLAASGPVLINSSTLQFENKGNSYSFILDDKGVPYISNNDTGKNDSGYAMKGPVLGNGGFVQTIAVKDLTSEQSGIFSQLAGLAAKLPDVAVKAKEAAKTPAGPS